MANQGRNWFIATNLIPRYSLIVKPCLILIIKKIIGTQISVAAIQAVERTNPLLVISGRLDMISVELAEIKGVDPVAVHRISELKQRMSQ